MQRHPLSSLVAAAALRCLPAAARIPRLTAPRLLFLGPIPRFSSAPSEDAATPPLLRKLKGELKAAMRVKDAPRLSVLRAIMSANLNASKTSTPVRTDAQLVALIRKIRKTSQDAAADAEAGGRMDLAEKEMGQIQLLDEYLKNSGLQTLGEAELRALVVDAVGASRSAGTVGKALFGDVMRRLARPLDGLDVDRKHVAAMVKEFTSQ